MKLAKRIIAIVCVILCMAALTLSAFATKPDFVSREEWDALKLTNDERIKSGLKPLSTFSSLENASRIRAAEIVTKFEHTRPNGESCYTAIQQQGVLMSFAAENIAQGQQSASAVVKAWMESPGHKANILDVHDDHLSVGFYRSADKDLGDGILPGYNWVQLFVGGCTIKDINFYGEVPKFDPSGKLLTEDAALEITCDMHDKSYLPLVNATYTFDAKAKTITINYDGFVKTLGITVQNPPVEGFYDIPANAWYKDYVVYSVQNKIFSGTSATAFSPDMTMTRAQLVQVLANISGVNTDDTNVEAGFSDVKAGSWYAPAVKWAAENGVVNGIGDGKFAPNAPVTREQMCVMLVNYVENFQKGTLEGNEAVEPFKDDSSISSWARYSVYACRKAAIINGKDGGIFAPLATATRAEAATVFTDFHKQYIK